MVKYVAFSLMKTTKVDTSRALLRQLLHLLDDVGDQVCTLEDCRRIVFNSTQREFIPILGYCKLFLSHSLIQFDNKRFDTFCLLINMDALFEKFVSNFLISHFQGVDGLQISRQKSDLFLTESGLFQLRHDIYVEREKRPLLIIDTKYKPTMFSSPDGKGGISQGDMYQLLSYCVRRNCNEAILLYPKYQNDQSPEMISFDVKDVFADKNICIRAAKLDLINLPKSKRQKIQFVKEALSEILYSGSLGPSMLSQGVNASA